jgi:hypothetical protein
MTMKTRILVTLTALALVLLVGQTAHAQMAYDFKVPFDFVAHGQEFKAGTYTLIPNTEDDMFRLQPDNAKGGQVLLPVETRLSSNSSLTAPTVVFDKTNGKLAFSELLVPGDDGYLFLVTKAKHTHEKVTGARRKG